MSRKVALITGAASGIGQALAVVYARTGVAVVGGYYPADPHDPQTTVALVEEAGGECLMLPLDVGDTASVDALAAQAVEHFGRLDYAVANAGLLRRAPLLEMTDALWDEMLNVDLTGVMRTFARRLGIWAKAARWWRFRRLPVACMAGKSTAITQRPRQVCQGCVVRWRWSWRPRAFVAMRSSRG